MSLLRTSRQVLLLGVMAAVSCLIPPTCLRADVTREAADPILRLDLPGHTGEVRALAFAADSSQLVSGGRDKVAIVWTLDGNELDAGGDQNRATRNIAMRRLKERSLRWQVARGTRGAIQAIAVSRGAAPSLVAIAGSGAMGSTGEILLLDAVEGTLVKTLGGGDRVGHRQSVASLDFTSDGSWLVSQDLDGQVFAWKRADAWKPVELAGREESRLGAAGAAALRRLPPVRPLAAIGADRVAFPALVSPAEAATPIWRIQIVPLSEPAGQAGQKEVLPADHTGLVTAMSVAPDGSQLVSADLFGRIHLLQIGKNAQPVRWEVSPVAESLAFLPDAKHVAMGIAGGAGESPRLEIWETSPPRRIISRPMPSAVRAVKASLDGTWLAWSGAERQAVTVEPIAAMLAAAGEAAGARRLRLGGVAQNITRVAFSTAAADARLPEPGGSGNSEGSGSGQRNVFRRKKQQQPDGEPPQSGPQRLAISTATRTEDRQPALESAFSITSLARNQVGADADWAASEGHPGPWSIRRAADADTPRGVQRWALARQGQPAGLIDLALDWQGRAGAGGTAVVWLKRPADAEPWAVAIGTDRGIFLYALDAGDGMPCRMVRRFRGHEDAVLCLAISEDGRWLASGGGDALVMLWSLSAIERNLPLTDRWGVSLRVENGRVVVDTVDETGPLAGKDVRAGDMIAKISWADGSDPKSRTEHGEAAAIVKSLTAMPWSTPVVFATEREGKPQDPFLRNPAWENLASLHMGDNREWAFWTPRGYYAASANGDSLFGWLVNRGLDRLPRFFKAQQFRRKLERPDVMSRLLTAGSLDAALRAAALDVPKSSAIVLPEQIAQTPDVRILSPTPGAVAAGRTITVTAQVEVPDGVELNRISAYASGAIASAEPRLVEDQPAIAGRPRRKVYAWELDLPAEDQHLVQVFVGTREGPTDVHEVPLDSPPAPQPRSRDPRLYLLACGIDHYAHAERFSDMGLTNLKFAVNDARSIRESLSSRSLELYELAADTLLLDAHVTRPHWQTALKTLAEKLAGDVEPDDLLVVFLAGHGMIKPDGERTYAYLCHDAEIETTDEREDLVPSANGSLTWQDFRELAAVPCRKLAFVDTCHSGALGPAGRSTTVREFQENMIVVLAAASDDEPSQESDAWEHGAFTKILLEALSGRADVGRTRLRTSRTPGPNQPGPNQPGPAAVGPAAVSLQSPNSPDGVISLDEVIDYVIRRVPELTRTGADEETAQHPTVSPEKLVPYVKVPLARVQATRPVPP